jgi:3-isopropylmalate/(R)-2-methylmalate dehydratase small subunit
MSQQPLAISHISGRGLPLRGYDIDTDRIMPARFLRAVSFEGLEAHVFEDDRAADPSHPFNDARYTGAAILLVNANFGCGSSREHAPQGLARAGIRALVGESFSEIFRGNAAMIGLPCFEAERASVERLQALVEAEPKTVIEVNVTTGRLHTGALGSQVVLSATLPAALREAFLTGQWSQTAMLLDRYEEVQTVADRLPYIRGF